LNALKVAIEKKPDNTKHSKMTHFNYARDNAIASLGKIIKHQQSTLKQNPNTTMQLVKYWISLLPITHDVEEAQDQCILLADFVLSNF
jgi:hypothetical protein